MASPFETGMSRSSPEMTTAFQRPGSSRSRTHSISSDRPSTATLSVMSPPLSASPEAAFIAASAASQIVTNDHDSHADTWYDQHGFQPSGETVLVSLAALRLVNGFLDHLLFNFLSRSGSTTLAALRPAVTEVLKPKLAKDAINNADEELREYLGGGDDDEFLQSQPSPSPRDWDLELVWKRTRLRCMVYSSLGDMEEEDEDHHMEEGLLGDDDENLSGAVSPAVAIFLTSILEFLGEQALISAGQAAWHRMRVKYEKDQIDGLKRRSDVVDRIVVEEVDMERVALDRTLGRLWRAWKKRIRYPVYSSAEMSPQSLSRERLLHFRQSSVSAESAVPPAVQESAPESPAREDQESSVGNAAVGEDDIQAAAVPLPMSERDIDEIEVPGLVHYSDDEPEEDEPEELDTVPRPKSMMIFPLTTKAEPPTPTSEPHTPTRATRKRANSLPTPVASPQQHRKAAAEANDSPEAPETADRGDMNDSRTEQVDDGIEDSISGPEEPDVHNAEIAHGDNINTPEKPLVDGDGSEPQPTGLIPKIVGVAAAAVGAVTGAAIAGRNEHSEAKDDADESDFEVEEAQILTSSRISIGTNISNRSNSPANSDRSSRPPLSVQTLPVRSGSLRLVNVASPRTPSVKSQMSSAQEQTNSSYSRSGDVSRASSVRTQPNLEEPRAAEDSRGVQVPVTGSSGMSRAKVGQPISEAEESTEPAVRKLTATSGPAAVVASRKETATGPKASEAQSTIKEEHLGQQKQAQSHGTQPLFGSVRRQTPHSPPPASPDQPQQQQTVEQQKSTALSTPPDSGTFFETDVAPPPPRHPRRSPRSFGNQANSPASTPIPEESVSTNQHRHGHSLGGASQHGTIGVVSVDRPDLHREYGDASRPSQDQSTIRQLHTSGSSSASSHKVRAARGSQDSTATRPEDVARNFEELIHSNETIQYTLTPENMREIEGSPRTMQSGVSGKGRKSEDVRQSNRDRAASAATSKSGEVKRSGSVTRLSPLSSHPVDMPETESTTGPSPRAPPVSMANRARGAAPQARDARVPRESLVEFAEFIRATGPSGADPGPAPLKRNQSLMNNRTAPRQKTSANMSLDYGRPSMGGSVSRARLQARGATVDNDSDNSDLIDFIRRGPPSAGGNPRIPRTVAPFRTTMDSDLLKSAVGGKAMDATLPDIHDTRYSQASTNVTEMSAPSVQSSINSQSALLGRKQPSGQTGNPFDEPDMMPQRKQHRVRDPYAIDLSDEEEEDDEFDPQPRRKVQQPKEESLMDFLNSAPPPPESAPVPFNLPRTQTMPAQPTQAPKKKASAPSLMSRFRQNNSSSGAAAGNSNGVKSPTKSQKNQKSSAPAVSKGYIPIQVNIPTGGDLFPNYGSSSAAPTVPNVPSSTSSSRPSGRVPMKRFEPRDAVSVPSRGTSDLADFLRSSGPPPSMNTAPYAAEQPETNGGSRLFGRRKKSMGFA
ncbi:hypothetical protein LA080_008927 [Diaporthe eres]|uniref:Flo11 n=1 Tax=Diaporthe vaccinii TaxID=105482 RepID=A0ABR4DV00_9PEZI|nr:hypothetical protein LA080_008927 [Diaporthe eres]